MIYIIIYGIISRERYCLKMNKVVYILYRVVTVTMHCTYKVLGPKNTLP